MKIVKDGFNIEVSEPILYVDNKSRDRSGHMTHAMVELPDGTVVDFNSNCSSRYVFGHSTFGFVEYRISHDGGETFSGIKELPYSKKELLDGIYTISVEKAVTTNDGAIVAFCLRNNPHSCCTPWDTPTVIISYDCGESWSEPYELCQYKGRIYDACYYEGVIYVLEFCNEATENFCGTKDDDLYRLFASYDNGKSFTELCVVPLPTLQRGYGAMLFDENGALHVYSYNGSDEFNIDHIVSFDKGKTWNDPELCFVNEGIRNPQMAIIDGVFVAHGRSKDLTAFVLYTSFDGKSWSEATRLRELPKPCGCYYSNNLILRRKNENRLLIQYSEGYGKDWCVNVFHMWLKIEK